MEDEIFCEGCEIIIPQGVLAKFGGSKTYKFKDGSYCEKCAKAKVNKARGGR